LQEELFGKVIQDKPSKTHAAKVMLFLDRITVGWPFGSMHDSESISYNTLIYRSMGDKSGFKLGFDVSGGSEDKIIFCGILVHSRNWVNTLPQVLWVLHPEFCDCKTHYDHFLEQARSTNGQRIFLVLVLIAHFLLLTEGWRSLCFLTRYWQ